MMKQMLSDDRNEEVREAVTKSLGLVLADMKSCDKYEQVQYLKFNLSFCYSTLLYNILYKRKMW